MQLITKILKRFKPTNKNNTAIDRHLINYSLSSLSVGKKLSMLMVYCFFLILIFYIFYDLILLSFILAVPIGALLTMNYEKQEIERRKHNLRIQFLDLLESINVSLRAGENIYEAFISATSSLSLLYETDSDILQELNIINNSLLNNMTLSQSLSNFALRSGVTEIINFADIMTVCEGKSDENSEIIRQCQEIIKDTTDIEIEIETSLIAKKNETKIMFLMPVLLVIIIRFFGNGFLNTLHTTVVGRIAATISLLLFIVAYICAKKITDIKI